MSLNFSHLLLFLFGIVAGILNVIAGGGSFLTVPMLIFLGLPPTVANGTNRVGILLQNLGAVWGFQRHGKMPWEAVGWAVVPATIGAVFGAWGAVVIDERAFKNIFAVVMVAVTLWSLWQPGGRRVAPAADRPYEPRRGVLAGGFFVAGIYGGFVQAGVGFLILAVVSMAGLDLVRGNALKVCSILVYTIGALLVFALEGKIDWTLGIILAAGTLIGGQLGVRFTVLKGHRWVRRVVTVMVIIFAVKLVWGMR
jgi:hypothetical protein